MLAAEISKLILQAGEEEASGSALPNDDESDAAQHQSYELRINHEENSTYNLTLYLLRDLILYLYTLYS
jgi:hypothetical protein